MKSKYLFIFISFFLACSQKDTSNLVEDKRLHIYLEDLYHEVMEVDSVLINGVLPVECTLSAAMSSFGDTLLTYFDYRFPYMEHSDSLNDVPIKIYVFNNALFRQWKKDKLIMFKLDMKDQNFIMYKGQKITHASLFNYLGSEFPNSYRISMVDEYFRPGSYNAYTLFYIIRASNSVFDYSGAYWRFFVQTDRISSIELSNFTQ